MKLFSKRNLLRRFRPSSEEGFFIRGASRDQFLNENLRIRLVHLLKHVTNSDDFFEKCIFLNSDKKICLSKSFLDNFSESQLGYKFSKFFKSSPFDFNTIRIGNDEENNNLIYKDDILFDFIETLILFSKKEKRQSFIDLVNNILKEEGSGFLIKSGFITNDQGEDLRNMMLQLKDEELTKKIRSYYDFKTRKDFVNASKVSAEILNMIISDEDKPKNKSSKDIFKTISNLLVENTKSEEFSDLLNESCKISQNLNNSIFDIRHSEKDRIKISSKFDFLHKMASNYTMSIVEVILISLKENYVLSEDWEEEKKRYLNLYKINKTNYSKDFNEIEYVNISDFNKSNDDIDYDSDIDPDDIPF